MRRLLVSVLCLVMVMLSAHAAHAQVTYRYTGNPFASFSCGNGLNTCSTPAPENLFTSYTATDFVSVALTFDDPLPPNFALQSVVARPGFALTISDGRQSLTFGQVNVLGIVKVATDPDGNIVLWDIVMGHAVSFAGIVTQRDGTFVRDSGKLTESNFAELQNAPGLWTTGPPVFCQVRMSDSSFSNGEVVTALVTRFANRGATPIAVEYKVWIEIPTIAPYPVLRGGADGSAVLPGGVDANIGPLTLFTVVPQLPRGSYAFSCRLVDPVTGQLLSESLQSFVVQ
jgi:hypothetical protein